MEEIEGQNAIVVSLDEYRVFHPRMKQILRRLRKTPTIFNLLTLDFAYKLEEAVLEKAIQEGYNIIYEVSLNTPSALIERIERAKGRGYETSLKAIATDDITSILGAQQRYEAEIRKAKEKKMVIRGAKTFPRNKMLRSGIDLIRRLLRMPAVPRTDINYDFVVPRLVNRSYHNDAYRNMLGTMDEVNPHIDYVQVYKRGREKTDGPELIYSSKEAKSNFRSAREAVESVRQSERQRNYEANRAKMISLRKGMILRGAKRAEFELLDEADRIFETEDRQR